MVLKFIKSILNRKRLHQLEGKFKIMTTSKEYLRFEKNNIGTLSKLKKQKHNFEPTYYQVIQKNIQNDK